MATIITSPILCTFIHIPKTGGNSITKWMGDNFHTKITKRKQHATVQDVKAGNHSLGPVSDLGWKFCVVRNPWDYMVSWYAFQKMLAQNRIEFVKQNPHLENSKKDKFNLELQQKRIDRLNLGFDVWIKNTQWVTQHTWAKDCDYIIKFENLSEEFKLVQEKLNCDVPLGHLNKTVGRPKVYKDYYTQETIDIVAEKYAIDIKTYNYNY